MVGAILLQKLEQVFLSLENSFSINTGWNLFA
jgi:hypothetical protein